MSPAYATPEQYERWFKRTCTRCGRHGHFAGRWPDGHVCRTCHDRALRVRGRCPGCDAERVLPGLRTGDGAAICAACAGFTMSYACSRCGNDGKLHNGRLCTHCTFTDRLTELLGGGTGRVRPELAPLAESLLGMDNPLSGLTWLYTRKGRTDSPEHLLRRLGVGDIELTHEAFHTLQPWRAAAHLRELLMACGILPAIDKQICLFERWLTCHLGGLDDPVRVQTIRRFATWALLPRLRGKADRAPLSTASRRFAGEQVKQATMFLAWLNGRDLGLDKCGQADIDAWHAEHPPHAHRAIKAFLQWTADSKLTRVFTLPSTPARRRAPLPPEQRMDLLRHVLTDAEAPLRTRVAAVIVLLYAQPASRIVRLTIDDVLTNEDQVLLRLGEPPTPVPRPVGDLLLAWIASRDNMNTATNHNSRWLFPGRRAGQPMNPNHLTNTLNALGIPTAAARGAAIRQHLLDMPAPVVADALGYHHTTTTTLAGEAGATWNRYAPGDHTTSPPRPATRGTRDGRLRGPASLNPGIVKRSLSWAIQARLNVRDYERLPQHFEALITLAAITLMTRRLARLA